MNADEAPPRWFTRAPFVGPLDSPPPGQVATVEFGARSRQGPRRPSNDDHHLILRLGRHQETLMTSLPAASTPPRFDEFGYGMLVADGIGSDGEAASRLAITTFEHLMVQFGKWNLRIDEWIAEEVKDRGQRFYRAVDSAMQQARRVNEATLQSTLTVVFSAGSELFFAHVGHSRVYLYRERELVQLTHDHTLASTGVNRAAFVDVAASVHDQHHVVTNTMGKASGGGPAIEIERFGLLDGDVVLLCSNGVSDVLNDPRIAAVLAQRQTPDDQCRTLVDMAMEEGGEDDATALVAHYKFP